MRYKSVIGFGKAIFVEDVEEKRRALEIIMRQYSDRSFSFPEQSVASTTVIGVEIEGMASNPDTSSGEPAVLTAVEQGKF